MIEFGDNFRKRRIVLEGTVTDKWFEMIEELKNKQNEQEELVEDMEKIYEVEFMQYTNYARDTVSDGAELEKIKYIHVGKEPFLIKESEFDKYMKFGKGFRFVRFVGNMEV